MSRYAAEAPLPSRYVPGRKGMALVRWHAARSGASTIRWRYCPACLDLWSAKGPLTSWGIPATAGPMHPACQRALAQIKGDRDR